MIKKFTVSLIAAVDEKRGLGKNNRLMWDIPQDLQRFKKLTWGHPIVMGRKTFESIGRPLPNRTNIIVTRDLNYEIPNTIVVHSLDEAIKFSKERSWSSQDDSSQNEIFIIGGGQIFEEAISLADKLYLTVVKGDYGADVFFPDYSDFHQKTFEQKGTSEEYEYTFLELERVK